MNIRGLYIDRKMLGILSVFVILGIVLVSTLIISTNTLSGLRAYSTLQTFWTEARKDATYELIRYLDTGEAEHLAHYDEDIILIQNARFVRDELISPEPDYHAVRQTLLSLHTQPRDLDNMIQLFERFHTLDYLSDAVQMWEDADRAIGEMEEIGTQLKSYSESGVTDMETAELFAKRILELDELITEQKEVIAVNLSDGTHLVTTIINGMSLALGGILLFSGFLLSYRFLKNIKIWARRIDMSEQRYKSLFKQNPNIVFSLNPDGTIVNGNEAFLKLTGFSEEDLNKKHYESFPIFDSKDDFEKQFKSTLEGTPQNFELSWRQSNEALTLYATMLPIRIDDNIEGVFVIAEDISYQKFAETKIKNQLEEKNSLLGEVHDRVKNNLALISSMLQLQEHYLNDELAKGFIESTISRIQSLALVHERLYQTENFSRVRLDTFIRNLVNYMQKLFDEEAKKVKTDLQLDHVNLDIKQAIPCGLLLNELIGNAFKFAFKDKEDGLLTVQLIKQNNLIEIVVKDNGRGLPSDFKLEEQNTLGMTLIKTLSKQLNGTIQIHHNVGTEIRVKFTTQAGILKSA